MYPKSSALWPRGEKPAQAYCGEDERLTVLAAHGTHALVDDPELQHIADFAAKLCETPIALVSLVERDRQHFLARAGLEERETPRPTSFCAHAMLEPEPMVIPDATKDERFANNPLVTGEPSIRFYAGQPLVSSEGAPLGALCVIDTAPRPAGLSDLQREGLAVLADAVMRRLSQRRLGEAADEAVQAGEAHLESMIDSVPGIAWTADNSGNFDYVNARWQEMTGIAPPRTTDEWRHAIHVEDWDATLVRFQRAVADKVRFEDEWRLRLADGSYRWVQSNAVPVSGRDGKTRWFGTVIDIDKQHRLSEARDMLASELSHRIKNIFAVVSGLVSIRARGKPEVAEFSKELVDTILALGAAHDYVRPGRDSKGGTLSGLIADLLAPYGTSDEDRFTITGAGLEIGPRAATPLALIFHELATNSAKYGALSCPDGHVTITVEAPCDGEDDVCVRWDETMRSCDVPDEGDHEGFGSRLLRMAVEGQLGGSFERTFSDDGLDVLIRFPQDSVAN